MDIPLSEITISGGVFSTGNTGNACPCQPDCGSASCGEDDSCYGICGHCDTDSDTGTEDTDGTWTCSVSYQSDSYCDCGCGVYDSVGCDGTSSVYCDYCNGTGSCADADTDCSSIYSTQNWLCY
jgi:hypothetical protein